jgi:hypothetical protein
MDEKLKQSKSSALGFQPTNKESQKWSSLQLHGWSAKLVIIQVQMRILLLQKVALLHMCTQLPFLKHLTYLRIIFPTHYRQLTHMSVWSSLVNINSSSLWSTWLNEPIGFVPILITLTSHGDPASQLFVSRIWISNVILLDNNISPFNALNALQIPLTCVPSSNYLRSRMNQIYYWCALEQANHKWPVHFLEPFRLYPSWRFSTH